MGGKGSGGARVGAGRKPKSIAAKILHGTATLEERRQAASSSTAPPPVLEAVEPPAGMTKEELKVWHRWAPLAIQNRTLTPATAGAFRDLCVAICIRDKLLRQLNRDGWTYKKPFYSKEGDLLSEEIKQHPLVPQHRAWHQRVEVGQTRFMLAPVGKEFGAGEKPAADPFDEFDDDDVGGSSHTAH